MKKTLILLMLFVMITLCFKTIVVAENVPGDEIPELYDNTAQNTIYDIGAINLIEEPEPEPDPEPAE